MNPYYIGNDQCNATVKVCPQPIYGTGRGGEIENQTAIVNIDSDLGPTTFRFNVSSLRNVQCRSTSTNITLAGLLWSFPYGDKAQFPYVFSGMEQEVYEHAGIHVEQLGTQDYGLWQAMPGTIDSTAFDLSTADTDDMVTFQLSSVNRFYLQYHQSKMADPMGLFIFAVCPLA